MNTTLKIILRLLPFWFFLLLYKFGAVVHFELISPYGEKVLPLWAVGALMAAGALAQMLMDVPAGYLLDRYGYRKLLAMTTVVFFFAGVILMAKFSLGVYIASFAVATLGWMFYGPGINAYVLSHATVAHSSMYMSLRDISASIGVVLASAILGFMLTLGTQVTGFVIAGAMALAFVAILISPKDRELATAQKKINFQGYYIRRRYLHHILRAIVRLNPASSTLLLLGFASSVFYGIIWFVVPVVISHQADGTLLSFGLGVFDLSVVIMGYFIGKLADRGNHRTLVFFGLLLFTISGVLLGINFGWLFLLFGFLATTGEELASISLWSWLHVLDKEHAEDGLVSGIINFFEDLGWAVGPLTAGILYGIIGPSWTIVVGALFLFATWLIYQTATRHAHHHIPMTRIHTPTRRRHKN